MAPVSSGFWSNAWRYTKAMPGFVLGTQSEYMGEVLRNSKKVNKWSNMHKQIGDAFVKGVEAHEAAVVKNGGFFKNMWHDLTSIFPDVKSSWKSAGWMADAKKASGLSKFWQQFKSLGKVFGKRMPLIGAVMTLAFELPNIAKASWNEGLLTGAGEAGKTAVRLSTGAIGGAIGSALIPVPFLGAMAGYIAGDFIGQLIVGKSYSEKQAEKEAKAQQQTAQEFKVDTSKIPFCGDTPINDEELKKLQDAYMQATNIDNMNNMNFMSYTTPQNTSTPINNPQPHLNTLG